ncbi:hypothetical protein KR093_006406, partial [Drosophila rubida]
KNNNYSAKELIAHRHAEVESPRIGLKRTNFEGSVAELEELQQAYGKKHSFYELGCILMALFYSVANLRNLLSTRRIERHTGRALAEWHADQQAAEVLRKDGKFESFGFNRHGKLYLEYYEALFLLELNRLQLEYCQMIVSVEQGYLLLLGEGPSKKYNNYLVYSTLSRAGYIVVKHQSDRQDSPPTSRKFDVAATREDCIWAILDETINNKAVPEYIKTSTYYATVQSSMTDVKLQIMNQSQSNVHDNLSEDFKFDTRKRRAESLPNEEAATKRACLPVLKIRKAESLIDKLKTEQNYERFKDIFEKFDIVQLQEDNYELDVETSDMRDLNISFDLHLHNEGFRRSAPKTPTFSVVIVPADEPLPTHNEMIKCQRQQLTQLSHVSHAAPPLLVMSVSESKQIQAFLYYMS